MTWGMALYLGAILAWASIPLFWHLPRIAEEHGKIGRDLDRIASALEKIAGAS